MPATSICAIITSLWHLGVAAIALRAGPDIEGDKRVAQSDAKDCFDVLLLSKAQRLSPQGFDYADLADRDGTRGARDDHAEFKR